MQLHEPHTYFIILPGISQHVFYFCCKINLMTEDANVGLFLGLLARTGESCFILILRHCPKTPHKYPKFGPHVMDAAGEIWLLLMKKIIIPSLSWYRYGKYIYIMCTLRCSDLENSRLFMKFWIRIRVLWQKYLIHFLPSAFLLPINFHVKKIQKSLHVRVMFRIKDPEYSRGRLSKALGQLGFWEFGGGGLGEGWDKGGSVYKQPETEVDDSCHS